MNPSQQPEALIHQQIDAAAKKLAECMDYPWEHMPEQGRANMRKHAVSIIEAALSTHAGADGWRPIADAPRDRTVLVGYWNSHGKWRTLRASYYAKGELPLSDDYPDDGDGFAPEGWYEEAYTHETIMPLEQDPVMFHPLPAPPAPEALEVP